MKRLGRKGLWVGSGVRRRDRTLSERTLDPDRERNAHTVSHTRTHRIMHGFICCVADKCKHTRPPLFFRQSKKSAPSIPTRQEIHQLSWSFLSIDHIHFPLSSLCSLPLAFVCLQCTPLDYQLPWKMTRTKSVIATIPSSVRSVLLALTCSTVGAL